jgi:hypothetical protein
MTTSIDPALNTQPSEGDGAQTPSWYWDENTPGVGARPDYLPEKFKSVADAAKSYAELEKRVGSAPSEYTLEKGESWIDPDYAPFQDMLDFAKQKHVPQDVMDSMLESVSKYLDEFKVDQNEEKTKLGEKADERLGLLDNWAKSNFSPETYQALLNNLKTADAILAFEEVRNKMLNSSTQVPNSNHSSQVEMPTLQDIQNEMTNNLEKYKTDAKYRKELQAKMEMAAKGSSYQDISGA